MTVTTPDIATLRRIVIDDETADEYEAINFDNEVVSTTRGDIDYGITFNFTEPTVVNVQWVRRVRDDRRYHLAIACWLNQGDQLTVTHDMFDGHTCDD